MQNEKRGNRSGALVPILLLALMAGIVYLVFVPRFGYYKDDWYLMYAAGTRGAAAFWDIFIIDRPLRTLVMAPAYMLFGSNPLYYNLSAYLFRVLSAAALYGSLNLLWARQKNLNLIAALLFLLYPGFLSQPNAIDYQSHIVGLAAGMVSIFFTFKAITETRLITRVCFFLLSILLGWLSLGQMEWYIGFEVLRWMGVFFLASRTEQNFFKSVWVSVRGAFPTLAVAGGFLFWRLFIFESQRGATDVDMQVGDIFSDPFKFAMQSMKALGDDALDSVIRAWYVPLRRLTLPFSAGDWLPALSLALLTVLVWILYQRWEKPVDDETNTRSNWRREAVLLGLGMVVFGLLPVIMVGRSVDFKNFSRYTLVASVGTVILLQAGLSLIRNSVWRTAIVSSLLVSASMTHYANGLAHVRETEQMNAFWWQVTWRIPQMEPATTLLVNYADITIEEDYFVWGPASLIYYPESTHAEYPQPGIYALLVGDETVEKILAQEKQEFSERRSIRTYPNYRNVLLISQPTPTSCVQVISGGQPEISSKEDKRLIPIVPFSEDRRIMIGEPSHVPPEIPFDTEPEHGWCFYYQKASLARQAGEWEEVFRLGEEAWQKNLRPVDQIEWMPFLQAYALQGHVDRVTDISAAMTDPWVREQACQILSTMDAGTIKSRDMICQQ